MNRGAYAVCILGAATAMFVGGPGTASAKTTRCPSFSFDQAGTPWKATAIRATGVSCRDARALIRLYARPRNCQFQPTCKVGRYTCKTSKAKGSEFDERCTRGSRTVSWHAKYAVS